MKIDVKCFAGLATSYECDYRRTGALHLDTGATVNEALDKLSIPADEVKIAFVNSKIVPGDYPLRDGDRLSLAPATGGM